MRIAVVGYGRMGRHHARVLTSLGHAVTTIDPSPAAGADLRGVAGLAPGDLAAEFDRAVIAVPRDHLVSEAERWQAHGIPTLIEKPLGRSAAEVHALDEELTTVGYVERFNPALRVLAENLERVGQIRHIESRRLGSVWGDDVLADLATHEFDVLTTLGFAPEAESVSTRPGHVAIGWQRGQISASYLYPVKVRTLEVVGADAMLRLDYTAQTVELVYAGGREAIAVPHGEPLREELIAWLADDRRRLAGFTEGWLALRFCEQARRRDSRLATAATA